MGLNKSKGNMYDFVTHTWNTIKGECYHDCSYCYMKRWGNLKPVRLAEKELNADLGAGNFIFVGSSCDMFAENIPEAWINKTLDHCDKFDNKYLFQSKNPEKFIDYKDHPVMKKSIFCTTIESNRCMPEYMGLSPAPRNRSVLTDVISDYMKTYVTIEPIMDFDFVAMVNILSNCNPEQINIGADSGGNNLPEPSREKILSLIDELETFTKVKQKINLKRLLK